MYVITEVVFQAIMGRTPVFSDLTDFRIYIEPTTVFLHNNTEIIFMFLTTHGCFD